MCPISARLPCRHSRVCRHPNLEKTKSWEQLSVVVTAQRPLLVLPFCLRMLFQLTVVNWCLFVCPLAFLLLCHIYVFCSTLSRREKKLAFSDEYKSYCCSALLLRLNLTLLFSPTDFKEGLRGVRGRPEGWQRKGHFHFEFDRSR